METTPFMLDPKYRWEPGCEFLLCWSAGRTPGYPPLEADGAHGPGDGGAAKAMKILSSGRLHAGQYGPGVPHGLWRAAVWDVRTQEVPFPSGCMEVPDAVLCQTPGVRWYAVELLPDAASSWTGRPDRAAAEAEAGKPGPEGARTYAVSIEYLGGDA